jgi:hypothetical protein
VRGVYSTIAKVGSRKEFSGHNRSARVCVTSSSLSDAAVVVHDAHNVRTSNNLHDMMSRGRCGVHLCMWTNHIYMHSLGLQGVLTCGFRVNHEKPDRRQLDNPERQAAERPQHLGCGGQYVSAVCCLLSPVYCLLPIVCCLPISSQFLTDRGKKAEVHGERITQGGSEGRGEQEWAAEQRLQAGTNHRADE